MRYNRRMFEPAKPAEAHFRHSMRELAVRGGAATRRRAEREPGYYKRIGHLGGLASVKTRRDRSTATLPEETPPQAALTRDYVALAIPEPAEDRTARCDEALPEEPADSKSDAERLAEMLAVALAEFDPPT